MTPETALEIALEAALRWHDIARETGLELAPQEAPVTAFEHVTPGVLTAEGGYTIHPPQQFQTRTGCFGAQQTARKRRHGRSLIDNSLENNTGKAPR